MVVYINQTQGMAKFGVKTIAKCRSTCQNFQLETSDAYVDKDASVN